MASFLSYALLFSIMAITIFTSTTMTADTNIDQTMEKICRQMEDYGFCSAVFRQNPLPPAEKNLPGLAKLTITQAKNNATNTSVFIQVLLPYTRDATMKSYLLVCSNAYNIVAKSFMQAMDAFNKGDYSTMLHDELGTPRAAASCETIFQTPPTRPSPLNERNREMRILITMAVITGHILTNEE